MSVTLLLDDDVDISRGDMICRRTTGPPPPQRHIDDISRTIASMSWAAAGRLFGRQIMSPRRMSTSSSSSSVTDIGRERLGDLRPGRLDPAHPGRKSRRQCSTSSPGFEHPAGHLAGVAAVVVQGRVGGRRAAG